jgi:hypothetical protein
MLDALSLDEKRAVLFATRLRFGAEVRVPREKAIDRIVEKTLYLADPAHPFGVAEVNEFFVDLCNVPAIRAELIQDSIVRLMQSGRIEPIDGKYVLSASVMHEIDAELHTAERMLDDVLCEVFGAVDCGLPDQILRQLFVSTLVEVFSRFGDYWVKAFCSTESFVDLVTRKEVQQVTQAVCRKLGIDSSHRTRLSACILAFFADANSPTYQAVKFNFGQSFYVAKLLGYDADIDVLSQDVYKDATFYLDSNTVLGGLLDKSYHRQSLRELGMACTRLHARLAVTNVTIEEASNRAFKEELEAERVYDLIPNALVPKTRGDFFRAYRRAKAETPTITVRQFFAPLRRVRRLAQDEFGLEVIDLPAEDLERDGRYQTLKQLVRDASIRVRGLDKKPGALRHDALHLLWIEKERVRQPKTWFVSLDRSLPTVKSAGAQSAPFALSLDGLVQSLSTFLTVDDDHFSSFPEIFSRLIAAQIMPQYSVFRPADFAVFDDLGMDCRELAPEDVESALVHVKNCVLHSGPSAEAPREQLMYALRTYFAAPERRVRSRLADRDEEIRDLRVEIGDLRSEISQRVSDADAAERRARAADESARSARDDLRARVQRHDRLLRGIGTLLLVEFALLSMTTLVDVLVFHLATPMRIALYPVVAVAGVFLSRCFMPGVVWHVSRDAVGSFISDCKRLLAK